MCRQVCALTGLVGITFNSQRISGTLPDCLGALHKLQIFALARNYIRGSIPSSLDHLTALETLMLSSNRLRCNAPSLNNAARIGVHSFQGITYPANVQLGKELALSANVQPFTGRLEKMVPKVSDVLLLYTGTSGPAVQWGLIGVLSGNPKLTTAAGSFVGTSAPMSLKQDAIMKGARCSIARVTVLQGIWGPLTARAQTSR